MNRQKIVEAIKEKKVLVSDGAWGTSLQNKGLTSGECPELWNIDKPDQVREVGEAYARAGAQILETNSFGGNGIKLAFFNLQDRLDEINRIAARLSREAADRVIESGEADRIWVMGSMGPTGKMVMMGEISVEEVYALYSVQARALEAGGAEALIIETMSAADEAAAAVRAARENTSCEIVASFTFEPTQQGEFRTMMGLSPAEAGKAMTDAGAHIVGANCGKGYEGIEKVIEEYKSVCPDVPVIIQTNAGLPQVVDGTVIFPATPEDMAARVTSWIEAGAEIIGGCCGTTPDHIRAIRRAVDDWRS